MVEMFVALWLSCCKPLSLGRVNQTFKPKARYRLSGQQQWHISNYPKTKCPSFVCKPLSGNSTSQHMELCLGSSLALGLYNAAIGQPRINWRELDDLLLWKLAHIINFLIYYFYVKLSFFFFLHHELFESFGAWSSKQATTGPLQHHYMQVPVNPSLTNGTL